MKNQNGRVLAYNLAKEITHEDLAKVAGGGSHISTSTCYRVSGSNNSWDAVIDVTMDMDL